MGGLDHDTFAYMIGEPLLTCNWDCGGVKEVGGVNEDGNKDFFA